jgi:papain like protease/putative peptidoglycan binding protein
MKDMNLGVIEDPRKEEEKEKDYRYEEIASTDKIIKVLWEEKEPRKFPIRNQDGSSSCVAQAVAKILGINNFLEEKEFIELSAKDIYTRRENTGGGMFGADALKIACDFGATLESLMPSQNMNEEEINKIDRKKYHTQIGKIFKGKNYIQLPFNIDIIGQQIQKGRGVLLFFRFDRNEWTDYPEIKNTTTKLELHHAVAGIDTTVHNGEKSIVIDDSWGEFHGIKGQRVVTESFLIKRLSFAGYIVDLQNDWRDEKDKIEEKPKYTFTKQLNFSSIFNIDEDVKWLQRVLIYENLFPVNVDISGYYGSITRKAVLKFQFKYNVASDDELYELDGRTVGPKTIKKLNELYK